MGKYAILFNLLLRSLGHGVVSVSIQESHGGTRTHKGEAGVLQSPPSHSPPGSRIVRQCLFFFFFKHTSPYRTESRLSPFWVSASQMQTNKRSRLLPLVNGRTVKPAGLLSGRGGGNCGKREDSDSPMAEWPPGDQARPWANIPPLFKNV